MKETGIIRRVDDLGRVVIPRDIRRFLHLNEGDPMEILVDKGSVTFRRYSPLKINRDICQMAGNTLKKLGVIDYAIYDVFDKLYGSAAFPANLSEEIRTAQQNSEPCFSEPYWIIPVSSGDQIYGYVCSPGKPRKIGSLIEYNPDRNEGHRLCIGAYQSHLGDPIYYEPFVAERKDHERSDDPADPAH